MWGFIYSALYEQTYTSTVMRHITICVLVVHDDRYLRLGSFRPEEDQGVSELQQIEKELQRLSEKEMELKSRKASQEEPATITESATGRFFPSYCSGIRFVRDINNHKNYSII